MRRGKAALRVAQQVERFSPREFPAYATGEDRFEGVDGFAEGLVLEIPKSVVVRALQVGEMGGAGGDAAHEAVAHVHPIGVSGGDDAEGGADLGVLEEVVETFLALDGVEEEVVEFLLLVGDEGRGDVVDFADEGLL